MIAIARLQAATSLDSETHVAFLERSWLGTSARDWVIALCVFAGLTILFGLIKRFALFRLSVWAEKTKTDVDDLVIDLVRRTSRLYLFVLAARIASHWITLADTTDLWLSRITIVATWMQVGLWGLGFVHYVTHRITRTKGSDDPARSMGASILGIIGRALVWVAVALLCLENLGIQVTPLLTGLGVGGIAVALALQNVLGDLFASITIVLDKPFVIGDAITLGEFTGTVEHIGVKTTRLRSVNGELIVVGNSDLVNSRIRNFKRLSERRAVFTIGVNYSTSSAELEAIPGLLREIVDSTPGARLDRAHFKAFGDWALVFEVVFFSTSPEFTALMDVQEKINFEIKRRFEARGIEMAFPTQTVHYRSTDAAPAPPTRS